MRMEDAHVVVIKHGVIVDGPMLNKGSDALCGVSGWVPALALVVVSFWAHGRRRRLLELVFCPVLFL